MQFALITGDAIATPQVVVVVGAAGAPEYGELFFAWADQWRAAAEKASTQYHVLGQDKASSGVNDRDRLKELFGEMASEKSAPVWVIFIGHGTFDGQTAKFNLRGPDVTAEELAGWLEPIERPVAVIQCASASAPFLNRLSGENRVIITSTKSGDEQNFARFGQYIAGAVADISADLDKDGQVSLLEAFLSGCRQLDEFYAGEARLATEHPLLDDNGDSLGTPAAWFRGIRATQRARDGATLDGTRAHQFHLIASDRERDMPAEVRQRRDELEARVAALREEKGRLDEDEYYAQLEELMIDLAQLYDDAE